MSNELLITIISVLWFITTVLVGLLFSIYSNKMKIVEDTQKNHNERLQRVEDVQGVAIADLKKDFADMEKKIDKLVENVNTLSTNIHKERGEEAALKYSLEALNKTLLMIQDRIS